MLAKQISMIKEERDRAIREKENALSRFEHFIANHSMEAYFKKAQYLVDHSDQSLTEKQKWDMVT